MLCSLACCNMKNGHENDDMKCWIFVVSSSDFYEVASSSLTRSFDYKAAFSHRNVKLNHVSATYDINKRVCFSLCMGQC